MKDTTQRNHEQGIFGFQRARAFKQSRALACPCLSLLYPLPTKQNLVYKVEIYSKSELKK